jgi:hypothetical protein
MLLVEKHLLRPLCLRFLFFEPSLKLLVLIKHFCISLNVCEKPAFFCLLDFQFACFSAVKNESSQRCPNCTVHVNVMTIFNQLVVDCIEVDASRTKPRPHKGHKRLLKLARKIVHELPRVLTKNLHHSVVTF